jgi:hypothetical protein
MGCHLYASTDAPDDGFQDLLLCVLQQCRAVQSFWRRGGGVQHLPDAFPMPLAGRHLFKIKKQNKEMRLRMAGGQCQQQPVSRRLCLRGTSGSNRYPGDIPDGTSPDKCLKKQHWFSGLVRTLISKPFPLGRALKVTKVYMNLVPLQFRGRLLLGSPLLSASRGCVRYKMPRLLIVRASGMDSSDGDDDDDDDVDTTTTSSDDGDDDDASGDIRCMRNDGRGWR